MSRTRDNGGSLGPSNPAALFAAWDSIEPRWKYWNKDSKTEEILPKNTPFIVLDQLTTVNGYNEPKQKGYWSNEVRGLRDVITVRSKDGVEQSGTWSELKTSPIAQYLKYAKSVYVLAKIGDGYELINLQMRGSSLTAWIEFIDSIGGEENLYGDVVVCVTNVAPKKKGAVNFTAPVFGVVSKTLTPAASDQADEADKKLQAFLDEYFQQSKEKPKEQVEDGNEMPKGTLGEQAGGLQRTTNYEEYNPNNPSPQDTLDGDVPPSPEDDQVDTPF